MPVIDPHRHIRHDLDQRHPLAHLIVSTGIRPHDAIGWFEHRLEHIVPAQKDRELTARLQQSEEKIQAAALVGETTRPELRDRLVESADELTVQRIVTVEAGRTEKRLPNALDELAQ